MSSTRLIVGLGNPGEQYRESRHNLGFALIDRLRGHWRAGAELEACRARVWQCEAGLLAQPQTYMNRSGWAIDCLVDLHAVPAERLLVAFDDVALPLGTLRLRARGGAGGHRGLESILASLRSEEVPRLRLGVGSDEPGSLNADLSAFVLAPFSPHEAPAVEEMLTRAVDAVDAWRLEGLEAAMNRFNG